MGLDLYEGAPTRVKALEKGPQESIFFFFRHLHTGKCPHRRPGKAAAGAEAEALAAWSPPGQAGASGRRGFLEPPSVQAERALRGHLSAPTNSLSCPQEPSSASVPRQQPHTTGPNRTSTRRRGPSDSRSLQLPFSGNELRGRSLFVLTRLRKNGTPGQKVHCTP